MIGSVSVCDVARCLGIEYTGIDTTINAVSTDSRTIMPGSLFVALTGEKYDGHDYIDQALHKGAVAVISQQHATDDRVLQVTDSLDAYGTIAAMMRDRFHGRLIALTGSSGKTTTRSMIVHLLDRQGTVHTNQGNENNEIGVSSCLLQLQGDEDFAVIEMGARKAGDIAWLSRVVRPDLGLIVNVSASHLETFGDLRSVASAKGELFDALTCHDLAVANGDDDMVRRLAMDLPACTYFFSLKYHNSHCFATDVHLDAEGASFCLHLRHGTVDCSGRVTMQVTGRHNIYNACASALCASLVGCSFDTIVTGLALFQPVEGRQSTIALDAYTTVVNDSYNANPASLKAAIDTMVLCEDKVRLLVLGDMLELGEASEDLHREIGNYAAVQGVEMMFTYGEQAQFSADAFCAVRPGMAFSFDSHQALAGKLNETLSMHGDRNQVLVKGSRSMAMEKVVDYLQSAD